MSSANAPIEKRLPPLFRFLRRQFYLENSDHDLFCRVRFSGERWVVGYYAVDVYEPKHLSTKYTANKKKSEAEKSADLTSRNLRMSLAASRRLGNATDGTAHGCVRDRFAAITAMTPLIENRPMPV